MQVVDRNGRLKVEITNTVDDLSIGVTTISGGTNGRVLYDNAGILGEIAGTSSQFIKGNGSLDSNTYLTSAVTSVGLSMPSAFSVANSPITTSGTIAVTGAGVVSQYIRGDGSLANFPTSTGGGASVSYYLNGSVSQGTIGGVAYKEINGVPVIGAGTDFSINADGYIAQFITDVGDPNKLLIPAGNWNFETYFSASSSGGSPQFYIELYKYNGTTFTLIASNSATPENITGGTAIDLYFTALAVPATTLLATDRMAVRFYVIHSGRTITMHTEDNHLSQIITTFSTGLTALNGLTSQVQYLAVGTTGTDFNISSVTDTHTFNLPTASATNRGALSSADWTTFNNKVPTSRTLTINGTTQDLSADRTFTISTGITIGSTAITSGTVGRVLFQGTGSVVSQSANLFWDITNNRLGLGTSSPLARQHILTTSDQPLLINTSGNIEVAQFFGSAFVSTENYAGFRIIATTNGVPYIGLNTSSNVAGNVVGSQKAYIGYWGDDFGFASVGYSNGTHAIAWSTTTGNVKIGGVSNGKSTFTDAGFKLDVNGTARVTQMTFPATTDKKIFLYEGITDYAIGLAAGAIRLGTPAGNRVAMGNYTGSTFTEICNVSPTGLNLLSGRVDLGADTSNVKLAIYTNTGVSMGLGVSASTFRFSAGGTTNNFVFFDDAAGNKLYSLISLTGAGYYGSGTINASAQLQVDSTTRGFLPPRMTTTQKNAIASPAEGLQVWDTTLKLMFVYNGTTWISL